MCDTNNPCSGDAECAAWTARHAHDSNGSTARGSNDRSKGHQSIRAAVVQRAQSAGQPVLPALLAPRISRSARLMAPGHAGSLYSCCSKRCELARSAAPGPGARRKVHARGCPPDSANRSSRVASESTAPCARPVARGDRGLACRTPSSSAISRAELRSAKVISGVGQGVISGGGVGRATGTSVSRATGLGDASGRFTIRRCTAGPRWSYDRGPRAPRDRSRSSPATSTPAIRPPSSELCRASGQPKTSDVTAAGIVKGFGERATLAWVVRPPPLRRAATLSAA